MINGERHIAAMQPYFFPYIGYWQLINAADIFVIYDDGHYIKRGWMHRNDILGYDNVSRMPINVKIDHVSGNKRIYEVRRAMIEESGRHTLETIAYRYKKAPMFDDVMGVLEPILLNPEPSLVGFHTKLIKDVSAYMGIETEFHLSTEVDKTGLEGVLQKTEKMCRYFGIMNYINPIGGTQFYDKAQWAERGVNLQFLKRDDDIRYRQFLKYDFVPDLSIIDMMMFCGVDQIRENLTKFTLL